mmetsp:Transcript_57713/g.137329  ORF Transcript_57713/g.137329 Transcript_57713/m.137329 type:complete len:278 (-) Transcript_57713:629-1462(-)
MYTCIRDLLQLWQPVSQISTARIVNARLPNDVEAVDASRRQTSCKHPIRPVRGHVVIYEVALEPVCTPPPVHLQIENKEGGDVLTASIRHPACLPQLAHVRVDQRKPCGTLGPQFELAIATRPAHIRTANDATLAENCIAVLHSKEAEKVARHQREQEPIRRGARRHLTLVLGNQLKNQARRQAPEGKPGGQLRRSVLLEHVIPCVSKLRHQASILHIMPEAADARLLASFELQHSSVTCLWLLHRLSIWYVSPARPEVEKLPWNCQSLLVHRQLKF